MSEALQDIDICDTPIGQRGIEVYRPIELEPLTKDVERLMKAVMSPDICKRTQPTRFSDGTEKPPCVTLITPAEIKQRRGLAQITFAQAEAALLSVPKLSEEVLYVYPTGVEVIHTHIQKNPAIGLTIDPDCQEELSSERLLACQALDDLAAELGYETPEAEPWDTFEPFGYLATASLKNVILDEELNFLYHEAPVNGVPFDTVRVVMGAKVRPRTGVRD